MVFIVICLGLNRDFVFSAIYSGVMFYSSIHAVRLDEEKHCYKPDHWYFVPIDCEFDNIKH